MKYKVLVFAYDFPHIKSHDMLKIFHEYKINPVVICSPFTLLKKKNVSKYEFPTIENQKDLCKKYNFQYYRKKHTDLDFIQKIVIKHKINIGLITGARILNEEIINLISFGIINYHPGKLPYLRGLDTFYWMIKKKINPAITVHFIDKKIDLGQKILIKKITVYKSDTINKLKKRFYRTQLECHRYICSLLKNHKKIKYSKIKFLNKNKTLNEEERQLIINEFKAWKSIMVKNEI